MSSQDIWTTDQELAAAAALIEAAAAAADNPGSDSAAGVVLRHAPPMVDNDPVNPAEKFHDCDEGGADGHIAHVHVDIVAPDIGAHLPCLSSPGHTITAAAESHEEFQEGQHKGSRQRAARLAVAES